MKRIALLLFLALALAAGAIWFSLGQPHAGFTNEVFLEVPKGTSTTQVANMLASQGVVRYPWQFLLARALSPGTKIQAGEYSFRQPVNVWEVRDRLARGDVFYYEISVPEGQTMFDIAQSAERLGVFTADEFLIAARNPKLIRDLAPDAPALEGYLFPATYRMTRQTSAEDLCRKMTDQFRREWKAIGGRGNVHRAATLASLIEKETSRPEERTLVASVFENRLNHGMRLECDPTTIYAALLDGRYRGKIYRSDLDNPHPYNTYQHTGLPPGPIANPGAAALRAALAPAETEFLFFVAKADGSGAHQFSATLASHARAVHAYRRGNH